MAVWLMYISKIEGFYSYHNFTGFKALKLTYFSLAAGLLMPVALIFFLTISGHRQEQEAWHQATIRLGAAASIFAFSFFQKKKVIKDFSQLRSINLDFRKNNKQYTKS
jgi:hypothetical protein